MKKSLLLWLFCAGTATLPAQQFFLGGSIAPQGDVISSNSSSYHYNSCSMGSFYASGSIVYRILFDNRLECSTGVTYHLIQFGSQAHLSENQLDFLDKRWETIFSENIHALTIPLLLGYSLPLHKSRLFLNFRMGMDFSFYPGLVHTFKNQSSKSGKLYPPGSDVETSLYWHGKVSNTKAFNLLLQNQVSLQYVFKSGLSLSLFASYHAGLRNIFLYEGHFVLEETGRRPFDERTSVSYRGSHYNIGIEVGYQFPKRKKE